MSERLPRLTATELIRVLQRDGWFFIRQHGSHRIFAHPTKPGTISVPMHTGKMLRLGTLSQILKAAGLTPDDVRELR